MSFYMGVEDNSPNLVDANPLQGQVYSNYFGGNVSAPAPQTSGASGGSPLAVPGVNGYWSGGFWVPGAPPQTQVQVPQAAPTPTAAPPTAPTPIQLPSAPQQIAAPPQPTLPAATHTPLPAATTPNAPSFGGIGGGTTSIGANPYANATYAAPMNPLAYAQGGAQMQGGPGVNQGGAAPTLSSGEGAPLTLRGGVSQNVPSASGASGMAGNIPPVAPTPPVGFGSPVALAGGQATASNIPAQGTTTAGPQSRGVQPQAYPQTQPPPPDPKQEIQGINTAEAVRDSKLVPPPPPMAPSANQVAQYPGSELASPTAQHMQQATAALAKTEPDPRVASINNFTAQIIDHINKDIPINHSNWAALSKQVDDIRKDTQAGLDRFKAQMVLPWAQAQKAYEDPDPALNGMSRLQFARELSNNAMIAAESAQKAVLSATEIANGHNDAMFIRMADRQVDRAEKGTELFRQHHPEQGQILTAKQEEYRMAAPAMLKHTAWTQALDFANRSMATVQATLPQAIDVQKQYEDLRAGRVAAVEHAEQIANARWTSVEAAIKSKIDMQSALKDADKTEIELGIAAYHAQEQARRDEVQEKLANQTAETSRRKQDLEEAAALVRATQAKEAAAEKKAKDLREAAAKANDKKAPAKTPEQKEYQAAVNKAAAKATVTP